MEQVVEFLTSKDETLKFILDTYGHPIIQKRQEGFASMCHIIIRATSFNRICQSMLC
ncbi:hypothetical protein [Flavobacterium cheonanense]|uniref:hypothetical protein n=1 Tax=Flavobacterium cheonanense TaxID=706183 RepID=UPI0031E337F3